MKKITLNKLREGAHWLISQELERCGRLLVTYYGKPLWVLRLATPEDDRDVEQKKEQATE